MSTTLFHLSDIHFGLEDNKALDWVKQEIAEKRPAAVAITGDLTMRARQREFAAACHWVQSLDVSPAKSNVACSLSSRSSGVPCGHGLNGHGRMSDL